MSLTHRAWERCIFVEEKEGKKEKTTLFYHCPCEDHNASKSGFDTDIACLSVFLPLGYLIPHQIPPLRPALKQACRLPCLCFSRLKSLTEMQQTLHWGWIPYKNTGTHMLAPWQILFLFLFLRGVVLEHIVNYVSIKWLQLLSSEWFSNLVSALF